MQRRRLLLGSLAGLAAASAGAGLWLQGAAATPAGFPSIAAARQWLARLAASTTARSLDGWPLPHVLEHAAQSVDYSLDGYPQAKPAWFQHSLGALAFAAFRRQGAMRHGLTAPIPGAPALTASDLATACQRLDAALQRFERHQGPLAPHFAYGPLDHADYRRAHLLHLADHARWIVPAPGE